MSVKSKMTAIADKIRALLGISGTMGLDAMSTNLTTIQTNISSAFTAVGNKGGTVPTSKVSGNLASAINSIPAGANVQIKEGTFTTSGGSASVNCGFQPDAIEVMVGTLSTNEDATFSAVFTKSGNPKYCAAWAGDWTYCNGYAAITRTATGFNISGITWYTDAWEKWEDTGETYSYVAIKYT